MNTKAAAEFRAVELMAPELSAEDKLTVQILISCRDFLRGKGGVNEFMNWSVDELVQWVIWDNAQGPINK